MTISKIFQIAVFLIMFFFMYHLGYQSGKSSVVCNVNCDYWKTQSYDIAYIAHAYQRLYFTCKDGVIHPETEYLKKSIDELVSKYNLDKGVPKP